MILVASATADARSLLNWYSVVADATKPRRVIHDPALKRRAKVMRPLTRSPSKDAQAPHFKYTHLPPAFNLMVVSCQSTQD